MMKININERMTVPSAAGIGIIIAAGIIVYAYFTSISVLDNHITVADNVIEISEQF